MRVRFTDEKAPEVRIRAKKYPLVWAEMVNLLDAGEPDEQSCMEFASAADKQKMFHTVTRYSKLLRDYDPAFRLKVIRADGEPTKLWVQKVARGA
jgi:hypothetical protein